MHINQRRNLIAMILVIAAATVFYIVSGSGSIAFDLTDDGIVLSGPEKFNAALRFADIAEFELRESMEPGTMVDGGSKSGCAWGIWENEEFGKYRLCVRTDTSPCIVATENNGDVTVFNFENADSTRELHRALAEHLERLGYDVETRSPKE